MIASWLQHLARASLEAGGVIAAIGLVTTLWPSLRASWRTLLWWCGGARLLLGLFTLPALQLRFTPAVMTRAWQQPLRAVGVQAMQTYDALQVVSTPTTPTWPIVLVALWGSGVAAGLAWMALQLWRQRRIVAESEAADERVLATMTQVATALELERLANVRVSSAIHSPLLSGFVRPQILLPEGFVARASDAELRLALCHELVHLQRHDLWLGIVPILSRVVFWFHPLAWWAAREYAQAREEATDAQVLATTGTPAGDYGQLLLAFMTTQSSAAFVAARAGSSHFESMKKRLEHLREAGASGDKLWGYVAIASFALLGLVPLQLHAEPAVTESYVRMVVSDPPVPPVPPRLATPPVPPVPPVPPTLPDRDPFGYVLFDSAGDSATMEGDIDDLRIAQSLRKQGDHMLLVRQDGQRYVVRDPAILARVHALAEPMRALGEQQSALGEKQSALGEKQSVLGASQAALGAILAGMAERRARHSSSEQAFDESQANIEQQMSKLGEKQSALGAEQEKLGAQQEKLGAQQERASAEMNEKLSVIVRDAIAHGQAHEL